MIRIVVFSSQPVAVEIESIEDDMENIQTFVDEGTPVVIVDELADLEGSGFDIKNVKIVVPEDD